MSFLREFASNVISSLRNSHDCSGSPQRNVRKNRGGIVCVALSIGAFSCGGGGGNTSTTTLSGVAMAGPVQEAQVEAFRVFDGRMAIYPIDGAIAEVAADGSFSLSL
jgi:hypothetical protein